MNQQELLKAIDAAIEKNRFAQIDTDLVASVLASPNATRPELEMQLRQFCEANSLEWEPVISNAPGLRSPIGGDMHSIRFARKERQQELQQTAAAGEPAQK
ncbi:MAG TPA: hypothetical protein VFA28_01835 [Bryobacteraceae bacterium]|nr:hypothetical protein [Bryobacteraceae bacterium]